MTRAQLTDRRGSSSDRFLLSAGSARTRAAPSSTTPPSSVPPLPSTTDPYTDALRTGRGPLFLRRPDGWLLPLEVERWCAAPDAADLTVLECCRGTVLDIGCGPGRLVAALAALGRPTLGIDVSPEAVARTVRTGGSALRRSVFDPLPREGSWGTTLLIDRNIGIGGDPGALLGRVAHLVADDGVLLRDFPARCGRARAGTRLRRRQRPGLGLPLGPRRHPRAAGLCALRRLGGGGGGPLEGGGAHVRGAAPRVARGSW